MSLFLRTLYPTYIKRILDGEVELLDSAFDWVASSEGSGYWYKIFREGDLPNDARIKLLIYYRDHLALEDKQKCR